MQGKLGPVTFTKSPYGPIARPTGAGGQQPNTPAQQAVRNRAAAIAAAWNALTDAQRLAWGSYASTQRREEPDARGSYRLTGYQAYYAPPASAYAAPAITITAAATSNTVTFTGTATMPTGTVAQFELQPLKSASRKPAKDGYRVKAVSTFTAAGTTLAVPVTPGVYCARYAFVNKSTGQRTGWREIPVSGVALALEDGGAEAAPAARKRAA